METPQIFYTKMQDGQPQGFPYLLQNLLQCGEDPRGQPDWAEFLPQPQPILASRFQMQEQQYVVDGDKVLGSWVAREMTAEERAQVPLALNLQRPGSEPDVIE